MIFDPFLHDMLLPKLSSLDQNLESILNQFQNILSNLRPLSIATQTGRTRTLSMSSAARKSVESTGDDWFDAEEIPQEEGGLITVVEQESETEQRDETSDEEYDNEMLRAGAVSPLLTMAPKRPRTAHKDLYPLGEWLGRTVKRRHTLPAQIIIPPPSILAFLRKNVIPLTISINIRLGKISARLRCQ